MVVGGGEGAGCGRSSSAWTSRRGVADGTDAGGGTVGCEAFNADAVISRIGYKRPGVVPLVARAVLGGEEKIIKGLSVRAVDRGLYFRWRRDRWIDGEPGDLTRHVEGPIEVNGGLGGGCSENQKNKKC